MYRVLYSLIRPFEHPIHASPHNSPCVGRSSLLTLRGQIVITHSAWADRHYSLCVGRSSLLTLRGQIFITHSAWADHPLMLRQQQGQHVRQDHGAHCSTDEALPRLLGGQLDEWRAPEKEAWCACVRVYACVCVCVHAYLCLCKCV